MFGEFDKPEICITVNGYGEKVNMLGQKVDLKLVEMV